MIRVTRLDRHELVLNSDLIESVEALPDTTLRLVTGRSLVVREGVDEVLARIGAWRAHVLARAGAEVAAAGAVTPLALPELAAALAGSREDAEDAA